MKSKIISAGVFLLLVLGSCKNDEKKAAESGAEVQSQTFDVVVDMVVPTDDDILLYYKDGSNEWFVEDKAIWAGIKGKNEAQPVVFHLPEGIVPNDLRLDIGRNDFKDLKNVEIKKMTLTYKDYKFEINQDQITTYFKPNQYIVYNAATKLYSFKKDDKGNYDPFFETKPEFYPELAKILSY